MDRSDWVFCAFVIVCIFAMGFFMGGNGAQQYYQNQAIDRGYAQHNPTTGQWEWIEPEECRDRADKRAVSAR